MVDAAVSFAIEKLGDFLIQEVGLSLSLTEDVEWLQCELRFMQSFLIDAQQKQVGDHTVQRRVFEINSVANDVLAILETYSGLASRLKAGKGDDDEFASGPKAGEGDGSGLASRLKACACICRKETKFYNVSKEIQSLKQRIMDLSHKQEIYGIRNINNVGGGPSNYRPNNQRSGLWHGNSLFAEKQVQDTYSMPSLPNPCTSWEYFVHCISPLFISIKPTNLDGLHFRNKYN
ncbi:putative disease resistance protein At1g50180 [Lycium ferocissimum]|uniref:putative disease resistance protein At1g50180 n=1 Tax=Lycium ferocissimum TaxID=112874 RepID=UPI0028169371|nr:putative disease resistance protein At1g50180 [Lycium ferocissimum]